MKPERLTLASNHWERMLRQATAEAPLECCGLLAGKEEQVQRLFPMRNAAHSPVRFTLDPQEQFDIFNAMEERGLELLGIYHSHPNGPASPSRTDIAEAAYPVVNLILSPVQAPAETPRQVPAAGQWQVRGFWIEAGRVVEVPLEITK